MASSYKVLGQSNPVAATPTDLYTVPGGAVLSAVCSTLVICNQGVSTTVRVSIRPAGAVQAAKHYVVYETLVNTYDALPLTLGLTLATSDVVTVYAGTSTVSFNLFGSENS